MKRFKELFEETLNEGGEMYPADEMTISELKIACYAANNILERLEDGAMIQRWQISAIVKAKEELASVYTSMSADEMEDDEDEMYWDEMEDEEPMYVGFEYPSMYGEEVELDEISMGNIHKVRDRAADRVALSVGKTVDDPETGKRKYMPATDDEMSLAKKGMKSFAAASRAITRKNKNEETDYEVDVEGLPKMYVKGDNPSQVKNNLRKVVKNPDMIRGVERVTKATLQKMFRDKAAGKDEVAEEVELDEVSKNILKSYITKKSQQIIDKDEKSDPYGMNSGGSSKERNRDFDKLNLARRKLKD